MRSFTSWEDILEYCLRYTFPNAPNAGNKCCVKGHIFCRSSGTKFNLLRKSHKNSFRKMAKTSHMTLKLKCVEMDTVKTCIWVIHWSESNNASLFQISSSLSARETLTPLFLNSALSKALKSSTQTDDKLAENVSFAFKFPPGLITESGLSWQVLVVICRILLYL